MPRPQPLFVLALLAIGVFLSCADLHGQTQNPAPSQPNSSPVQEQAQERLDPGKQIDRAVEEKTSDSYQFSVSTGQFIHLVLFLRNSTLRARLLAPDGSSAFDIDFTEPFSEEGLSAIAKTEGIYHLLITSTKKQPAIAAYTVTLEPPRIPTPQDTNRMAAEELSRDARRLAQSNESNALSLCL
jgi:hypothetical protein